MNSCYRDVFAAKPSNHEGIIVGCNDAFVVVGGVHKHPRKLDVGPSLYSCGFFGIEIDTHWYELQLALRLGQRSIRGIDRHRLGQLQLGVHIRAMRRFNLSVQFSGWDSRACKRTLVSEARLVSSSLSGYIVL